MYLQPYGRVPERWGHYERERKNTQCILFAIFLLFYCKCIERMSKKALGNYSASIWSKKCSILLLEKPKPNIFMISIFLRLVGTRIYDKNT